MVYFRLIASHLPPVLKLRGSAALYQYTVVSHDLPEAKFLWKAITGVHTPAASHQSGPSASAPGVRAGAQVSEHSRSGERARSH